MKLSYKFIYVLSSFITYVFLGLIEFVLLKGIIEYFFVRIDFRMIAYVVLLVVINPIITYIVINRIPLEPDKRITGNIDEELKRHK